MGDLNSVENLGQVANPIGSNRNLGSNIVIPSALGVVSREELGVAFLAIDDPSILFRKWRGN